MASLKSSLKTSFRNALASLPKTGLVKKPFFHPNGISFVLPVKDEERWIKPSIQSILEVADEIIVVDGSTMDETPKIVDELASENSKIKHIRFLYNGPAAIALSLHIGVVACNYRWLLRWDGDFVAKSTKALMEWKTRLDTLDKNKYYVIDLPRINLEGDVHHQFKDVPYGGWEARIFTWSPELRWIIKDNITSTSEQLVGDSIWGKRLPPWYKTLSWDEPYIYHCNIKSPKRVLLRQFWMDYMKSKGSEYPTLEKYASFRVKKDWGVTMEQAEAKIAEEQKKRLEPYDKTRFGELPEILQKLT
jgi:glycosyltransferase involved in cell wall biosynthesis